MNSTIKVDKKNKFISTFNPMTGFYMRSGILNEDGKDTNVDPFMSSFPELIDVGIMGFCKHSKYCTVGCYQGGDKFNNKANMLLSDYKKIIDEGKGKLFQCLEENEVVVRLNEIGMIEVCRVVDINIGDPIWNGKTFVRVLNKKISKSSNLREIVLNGGFNSYSTENHYWPIIKEEENKIVKSQDIVVGYELIRRKEMPINNIHNIDWIYFLFKEKKEDIVFIKNIPTDILEKNNVVKKKSNVYSLKEVQGVFNSKDTLPNITFNIERSSINFNAFMDITPELCRLLGYYVGNGSKRSYTFGSHRGPMIEDVIQCFEKTFPFVEFNVRVEKNATIIELNSELINSFLFDELLGCRTKEGEKTIPDIIFNVSDDLKLDFLTGFFCDATLEISTKDYNKVAYVFNTSSKNLKNKLTLLLNSLGIEYIYSHEDAKDDFYQKENRIIHRKERYKIKLNNSSVDKFKTIAQFHERFKEAKVVFEKVNRNNVRVYANNKVKKINNINEEMVVVDIEVDSMDHLFLTTHGLITHNCALGGHGDPDEHENFLDILKYTRENNIVPNFTTSGFNFNDRKSEICKEFCGAVAVSHYSKEYTRNTIHSLLRHGVKTNIHFVLSEDTIDEAIAILEPNEIIDKGINAIIFLMHKPVGLGSMEKVLKTESKIQKFFELVDNYKPKYEDDFKIGFDSCSIPAILNYTKNINKDSIDTCEGARWSMYITADMKALPCSFDQDHKWAFDIKSANIKDAWESDQFNDFRNYFLKRCPACYDRINCMGGCPIKKEIVLCQRPQRSN